MKPEILNLGTHIKWFLGQMMARPVSPASSSRGVPGALVTFIHLLTVLLIPGGILVGAYWWLHQTRGTNLQPPASNLTGSREMWPEKIQ